MAVLTVQPVPITGADEITFTAADELGDEVAAGACTTLLVRNAGVAPVVVTAATPGTVQGLEIEDPSIEVLAGGIGALPLIVRLLGGTAEISYSTVTDVTVAAIQPAR